MYTILSSSLPTHSETLSIPFLSPHHSDEIMYPQQKLCRSLGRWLCVCVCVCEWVRIWGCECIAYVFDAVHSICSAFIANQLFPPLPPLLPFSLPPPPPLCLLIQQWVAEVYCSVWWMWNSSLMEWISHSELVHIACTYSYIIMPLLEA